MSASSRSFAKQHPMKTHRRPNDRFQQPGSAIRSAVVDPEETSVVLDSLSQSCRSNPAQGPGRRSRGAGHTLVRRHRL